MAEKKDKQMLCRATETEKKRIERKADEHGFSSVSRYMVETAAEGVVLPPPEEPLSEREQVIRDLQEEVKALARQVEKAGVNLNQVNRRINAARSYDVVPALELRYAAEQVEDAAAVAAETVAGLQGRIDEARQQERRRRKTRAGVEVSADG